jgi:sulfur-oxidizing protein SoxZ
MRIRAAAKEGVTEVRVLMNHEMETGLRMENGVAVPAWFIREVTASLNGKPVLTTQWGPSVSKNPYFAFKIKGGKAGDKVSVTWVDTKGDTRTDEANVT